MNRKFLKVFFVAFFAAFSVSECTDKKPTSQNSVEDNQSVEENDKTFYGVCGEATTMNNLQLITDLGDTIEFSLLDANDNAVEVKGGLMVGDRLAVLKDYSQEDNVAATVINITSLLGRWSSIDKDFVIEEGGVVKSNVKMEDNSWVSWKLSNGKLLLNKDTFSINDLGSDSLYLENDKGIYVYTRREQSRADKE